MDGAPSPQDPAPVDPRGRRAAALAPRRLVAVALVFYGVLAAVAGLWRVGWSRESLLYATEAAAARGVAWTDLGLGLSAAALVVWLSWEFTRRTRAGEALGRALAGALGPVSMPQCLLLALASGTAEEAFFRGALQPQVGLLAASALFALAHFVPRRELLPWSAFSLAAGFLLGALYELTGNLVAPIAAHVGVNAVNLNLLVRRFGGSDESLPRIP